MAGWGFGNGAIGPEFRERACEIATLCEVRNIGQAGHWIVGAALTIVGAKAVVSESAGGNVQRHAVVRRQLAAAADHFHNIAHELEVTRATEMWRRPRIDPRFRRIRARQHKRSHAEPLRAEVVLDRALWKAVLVHRIDDLK